MSRLLTPGERRERLEEARKALRVGSATEMRAALDKLPADGFKAAQLRANLQARLTGHQSTSQAVFRAPQGTREPVTIQSGGVKYVLKTISNGAASLFQVRTRGATVEVVVNSAHPACNALRDSASGALSETGRVALTAWAMLEFEAGSERRRDKVRDIAEAWARILGRVCAEADRGDADLG